jgi:hypothetical protein
MERTLDALFEAISQGPNPRLHEIDIENLAGAGLLSTEVVRKVKALYENAVGVEANDLVVVAAGPQNKGAVFEGWGQAVYKFRKGKDGADDALVSLVDQISDLTMFGHIFIGSGDSKLAQVAEKAKSQGVGATVVTYNGQKSWMLADYAGIQLARGNENDSSH